NMQFGQLKTAGGYLNAECTSAMQKCIRRGLEEEALFWATELDLEGYGAYVWKRLQIIASEDIGLADSNVCVQVRALYEDWVEQRKNAPKVRRNITGRNLPSTRDSDLCPSQEVTDRRHGPDHDVRE